MTIVFLDGQWLPEEEATISVTDRGFLFGDGVYATLQVKQGIPLFLSTHLERLQLQCQGLHIDPPTVQPEWIEELIERNHAHEGIWRLKVIITGGNDPRMSLPKRAHGHVLITMKPFFPPPYQPLKLGAFPYPMHHCHAQFKSLAHLNRYYVLDYAHNHGLDDCVTCTEKGTVLEAAFGNLLWHLKGTFYTPSPELPLNFGVTITKLMEFIDSEGFKIEYACVSLEDIPSEANVFRTNTMGGIRPIERIEKRAFSRGIDLENALTRGFEKFSLSYSTSSTVTPRVGGCELGD